MALTRTTEPITADDAAIRAALADAFLPALLPALAQATGDFTILRAELRPPGIAPGVPQGGMSPQQQEAAREIAFEALKQLRIEGETRTPAPLEDAIKRITAWMTGSQASDDYLPLLLEELGPEGEDPRAPQWRKDPNVPFTVAIIGAGMSGILAGIRLKQAGVPFVILEKNHDVGGTWLENTYPGARVDVSNAFYSYSFAQKTDWPKHYSTQDVLLDYFRDVAGEYGIREHVRFNTEVLEAAFDEASGSWRLQVRGANGAEETVEVQGVISAVGQLNRPKMPEIKGMETFRGPSFHSARWDHSVDLKGKRVVVIGTGASAAQFIPSIAPEVADLTVFQRTPPWLVPVPQYHDEVPGGLQWLFRHVPHYVHWYRFWLFWNTTDGMLAAATVDESWEPKTLAVSEANDQLRMLLTGYLQMQFGDRPDLLEKVLPKYPPAAKRLVLDNGIWAATLKRDNVHLVTDGIREVTATGGGCGRRDGVPGGRDHLWHRVPGFEVPDADAGEGQGRGRPACAVERRRAGLHGHHGAELPQPVPALWAEHEHRGERQHHLLLRVRSSVRARLHQVAAGRGQARAGLQAGGTRCVQRAHRPGEPAAGLGRQRREQLVQERQGEGGAELAVQPD
ncbi:MAG: NAD(P)/FAD-dependent oxidoreductase [Dehalococcoidia bacterium]|nr:NAD(P)/FAD-dependent oxidoreductase [Dehalococcoidia bacterium]